MWISWYEMFANITIKDNVLRIPLRRKDHFNMKKSPFLCCMGLKKYLLRVRCFPILHLIHVGGGSVTWPFIADQTKLTFYGPHSALMFYALYRSSWCMDAALASPIANAELMNHAGSLGLYLEGRHDAWRLPWRVTRQGSIHASYR